ncbi:MAG TPA: hypothetical protein QGF08_00160 [Candidatus Marinimicrobia bacterium]|jgi:hypothetical protein|nr:hypothetical protein [Candidatus Neomarinimicrobiota bacterium]HBN45866.1 hypothetical protein [Candidatus Neomarinimicrobiota bacterium]HJL74419.1 hypothetical protein [Candidatus Neomarinimicrobiota bacterium]HJM69279.1 hypothetical protein [Candidatus Neomarinimicrobiota bacterium]|tara:strand:+ start:15440 stop:16012 length:573 start_codon:yes stop_codon:yes gene_type:complete
MASDVRSGIGFIIPLGAIVGFVLSVLAENYVLGIFFAVAGVLIWLLYFAVMDTAAPDIMGNFIILFGVLLSLAVFMNFGWEQNMWGGIEFKAEGSVMALVVLFFGTLSGVLYRQKLSLDGQKLTAREQELVDRALLGEEDPRVIVVKQEKEDEADDDDEYDEYEEYDYSYPYYFNEDDEYEYVYEEDEED